MIKRLKYLVQTELIKTFILSGFSTFFRSVIGLIINKMVAAFTGPVGVALVGQFSNFFGLTTTIASGGIGTGVVKYIAKHQKDEMTIRRVISTSAFMTTIWSIITAVVIFSFAGYFSYFLFKSYDYKFIIYLAALSLVFVSVKDLLMAILNGHKQITKYTLINIFSGVATLVVSLILVTRYKLPGIMVALVICQFLAFIITLLYTIKYHHFRISYFYEYFDRNVLKNLSKYSAMTLVSFSFPLTLLFIRNYIGTHLSWNDAGYWQGIWLISEGYIAFLISTVSFYYLPRLSEITDLKEIRAEIFKISKITLPLVIFIVLIVFSLKKFIVTLLFTDAFSPMIPLFKFQLIGDVFRFAGWLISYQMYSRGMTKIFITTSTIFNFSFLFLSIFFINIFGLIGVTISFCVNSLLYLIFMPLVFRHTLFGKA